MEILTDPEEVEQEVAVVFGFGFNGPHHWSFSSPRFGLSFFNAILNLKKYDMLNFENKKTISPKKIIFRDCFYLATTPSNFFHSPFLNLFKILVN